MRVISGRAFDMILLGGYVRRLMSDVRLGNADEWVLPVRLMAMGRIYILLPGQWWRRALAKGVY
jgi:hypothetical protein